MIRKLAVVCLSSIAFAVASCSSPRHDDADRSWAKSYDTVAEVAADAKFLVKGKVIGKPKIVAADSAGTSDSKSNLYQVQVTSVTVGDGITPGQTITVRGDAPVSTNDSLSGNFAVLSPGSTYVLYLIPFTFQDGVNLNQYIVVGQDAAYLDTGGGNLQRITTRDSLPREMSESALLAATNTALKG